MATDVVSDLERIRAAIREGRFQEADNALSATLDTVNAERAASAGETPRPAPPRSSAEVTSALFAELASLLGNPPRLSALLDELAASGRPRNG